MTTFRSELREIASRRNLTLVDIARELKCSPNRLSVAGTEVGISYNELNKIFKIIKADIDEQIQLRHLAKFTTPRKGMVIDDDFIGAIEFELIANDSFWDDYKQVCKAVLKFAGVKVKQGGKRA